MKMAEIRSIRGWLPGLAAALVVMAACSPSAPAAPPAGPAVSPSAAPVAGQSSAEPSARLASDPAPAGPDSDPPAEEVETECAKGNDYCALSEPLGPKTVAAPVAPPAEGLPAQIE